MSESGLPRKLARRLIGLFIGTLVLLAALALFMMIRSSRCAANEQLALKALKDLAVANCEFRSEDRDGNGVNDFWTGDVAALRYLEAKGKLIGLIPAELADADGAALEPLPGGPRPCNGYLFAVLRRVVYDFDSQVVLQKERDSKGREVYHPKEFGYCAYPAEYGVTGKRTFFVISGHTYYQEDTKGQPRSVKVSYRSHYCEWDKGPNPCPPKNCPEQQRDTEYRNKLRAQCEGVLTK